LKIVRGLDKKNFNEYSVYFHHNRTRIVTAFIRYIKYIYIDHKK
jgi:hypothetical protein